MMNNILHAISKNIMYRFALFVHTTIMKQQVYNFVVLYGEDLHFPNKFSPSSPLPLPFCFMY